MSDLTPDEQAKIDQIRKAIDKTFEDHFKRLVVTPEQRRQQLVHDLVEKLSPLIPVKERTQEEILIEYVKAACPQIEESGCVILGAKWGDNFDIVIDIQAPGKPQWIDMDFKFTTETED